MARRAKRLIEVWIAEEDGTDNGMGEVIEVWDGQTFEITFQGKTIARLLPDGTIERES